MTRQDEAVARVDDMLVIVARIEATLDRILVKLGVTA